MIKIRVIRDTYDATVDPVTATSSVLWVGCIPSQIADLFQSSDDSGQDPLGYCETADGKIRQSTRFEGFAEGVWYRIEDPRTQPVPATEDDFIDQLYQKGCPQCYRINPDAQHINTICPQCEQDNQLEEDTEPQEFCLQCSTSCNWYDLNDDGLCGNCAGLVECTSCPFRFEESILVDGECSNCHTETLHDKKRDVLIELEE